ncbi:unnamed protein product [Oppiella nova]|uniref:MGAT4 conserved region domain-containing protein n=1 Tax=Oppiella nova TaxID=334625 RepID=A0A7R9LSX0_9ACAR|nr:unnamed protein product [Oppiella nova]CAG2166054.1 unnamed protein product [Oppiella nova]
MDGTGDTDGHHMPGLKSATSGVPAEHLLTHRLMELSDRLKHSQMLSTDRKRDISALKRDINDLRETIKLSLIHTIGSDTDRKAINESHVRQLIHSLEGTGRTSGSSDVLQLPSIHHFLPHLLSSSDSLKPAFRISKNERSSVTMVFGVPTVKRDVESYLVSTLHNLIDNMSVDERLEAIIVVFIAETDLDYVTKTANELESQFGEHIDSGLLEAIPSIESAGGPNKTSIFNNFLASVDQIDDTVTDKADDSHARTCCGYATWFECTNKLIKEQCGENAIKNYKKFMGGVMGTLTDMACPADLFPAESDQCQKLKPAPGTKPKGKVGDNALTKYVTSMFSFLFITE